VPSCSDSDLKKLFARSGGVCAFPGCNEELVCRVTNDVLGHIAHITANSDGGPRADPSMPASERNSFQNLLLLCRNHHAEIDSPAGARKWSRQALLDMKREHERWVAERVTVGVHREFNVAQLSYLNVPRLSALALLKGYDLDLPSVDEFKLLIDGGLLSARLIHHFREVLSSIDLKAVAVDSSISSDASLVGVTGAFEGFFRTKNLPTIEKAREGTARVHGTVDKDPHVYLKLDHGRFILPIDPKWILTVTGWGDFRASGRHTRLTGACTIKHVNPESGIVIGSPLFIGTPRSHWDDLWSPTTPPKTASGTDV
jgi:HNH endonuclease